MPFPGGRAEQASIHLRQGTDKPDNGSTQTQPSELVSLSVVFTGAQITEKHTSA